MLRLALASFCFVFITGGYGQNSLDDLTTIRQGVATHRISSYDRSGGNRDRIENIAPGERRNLCDIKGAGMINHIWITINPEAPQLSRSDIILRIYWDGHDYPSVESPIGPFFGQGWDETYKFVSLPLAASPVKGNAMVSYFKMPFARGARIEIENQSDKKIAAFYYYIDYIQQERPRESAGYFHAWYNYRVTPPDPQGENEWGLLSDSVGKNPRGDDNYLIMQTTGKGQFVGVNYFVNCPTPIWYGEGDDMFFIDGDTLPTLHGTGTEDYFNSSWCPNEIYMHPYFGYARVPDKIGWLGRTHAYRFHIDDPIYFNKSLRFTIEHGHKNYLTLELSSVAYWYQDKPVKVMPIPDKKTRILKPEINMLDIHRWRDAWREKMGVDSVWWGNEQ